MNMIITILMTIILALVGMVCVPSVIVNAHVRVFRQLVTGLVGAAFLLSLALLITDQLASAGTSSVQLIPLVPDAGIGLNAHYDGVSGLMLLLVSFVGFIVSRFSIRYLAGESAQGKYFRSLGFTIGAVLLLVLAGNLVLFFVAWVMTSLGLHQLLLHYGYRVAAHKAAWRKFAISRLGDLFLIGAMILTFQSFGTFDFIQLFEQAQSLAAVSGVTTSHAAIGWLLMLGAATKSAQFPFHVWLPDTMETPTPVSALMHAGIVNAGGYLIIRLSPLLVLAPSALMTLAAIGALTACYGSLVMMTQPSVKRGLAYSTIAQMGFMMLQCGLGAFSAAMLHIIAHSLYKAYAFLSSGSILAQSAATSGAAVWRTSFSNKIGALLGSILTTLLIYFATLQIFGISLVAKPGGLVLSSLLCLALTLWSWKLMVTGQLKSVLLAIASVGVASFVYLGAYLVIDRLLSSSLAEVTLSAGTQAMSLSLIPAFLGLFALSGLMQASQSPGWLLPLRVHATNGFYIDAIWRRLFAPPARS